MIHSLDTKLIIERILGLMNALDISAKDFAISIGRKPGIITDWKTGRSMPSIPDLIAICSTYRFSIEKLFPELCYVRSYPINESEYELIENYRNLSDIDKHKIKAFIQISLADTTSYELSSPKIVREESTYQTDKIIPILGKVAAGEPILACETQLDSIVAENTNSTYALIAQGNSMYPIINDGETIEVITQKVLENGEIGIIKVGDAVTCKRFYNMDDYFELRSLNPEFDTLKIQKNSSTTLQIVGKVALTKEQLSRF